MSETWITNHIDIRSFKSSYVLFCNFNPTCEKSIQKWSLLRHKLLFQMQSFFAPIQLVVLRMQFKKFSLYLPRKWLHMSECFDWSLIWFLFSEHSVVQLIFKTSFLKPPSLFILSESKYATEAPVDVATSLKTRALRRGQRGRPPSDISGRLNRSQALW